MAKLTIFWRTFIRSLKDPGYYKEILSVSISFSLKYLFALLFFIMLLKGIFLSLSIVFVIPKIPTYLNEAKNILRNFYPPELTVIFKDGNMHTNVDEPYFIPFPKQFNIKDRYLAVIDTKTTVDSIEKYKTMVLFTKNSLVYTDKDSNDGYKVYPFSKKQGFGIFNREAYDHLLNLILPYFKYVPYALYGLIFLGLVFYPFFGSLFTFPVTIFYVAIFSFLLLFIAKLMKKDIIYKQIFHLGLHGITFSLIFDMLKSFFNLSIPYTFVAPFIIWMIIVLNSLNPLNGSKNTLKQSAP